MSPLAHFPGGPRYWGGDEQIYLNPIVLCFDNKECDKLLKLGIPNPIEKTSSIKATFKEDDEMRNTLLKENPKDLRIEFYDREGLTIRRIYMRECKCIEIPDNEVEIQFDSWEDMYY